MSEAVVGVCPYGFVTRPCGVALSAVRCGMSAVQHGFVGHERVAERSA